LNSEVIDLPTLVAAAEGGGRRLPVPSRGHRPWRTGRHPRRTRSARRGVRTAAVPVAGCGRPGGLRVSARQGGRLAGRHGRRPVRSRDVAGLGFGGVRLVEADRGGGRQSCGRRRRRTRPAHGEPLTAQWQRDGGRARRDQIRRHLRRLLLHPVLCTFNDGDQIHGIWHGHTTDTGTDR